MRARTLIISALLLTSAAARAEVFELLDNSKVSGKILHYYDGVFAIEPSSGGKLDIPTSKVKSITFKLPAPRADFATPQKTFDRYKDALAKSDWPRAIECMALMYQGPMAMQMGQAEGELKKMQKEFEGTKFDVKSAKVTGSQALLKVQRTRGDDVETMDVHLVLENGEWKLLP